MRILADTHAFFWWLKGDQRLSRKAFAALEDASNHVMVSAVVAWEIATKSRAGKWPGGDAVVRDIDDVVRTRGLEPLSISIAHARLAGSMAGEHRDPFDRLLAAQAEIEKAPIVTVDRVFRTFGVDVIW